MTASRVLRMKTMTTPRRDARHPPAPSPSPESHARQRRGSNPLCRLAGWPGPPAPAGGLALLPLVAAWPRVPPYGGGRSAHRHCCRTARPGVACGDSGGGAHDSLRAGRLARACVRGVLMAAPVLSETAVGRLRGGKGRGGAGRRAGAARRRGERRDRRGHEGGRVGTERGAGGEGHDSLPVRRCRTLGAGGESARRRVVAATRRPRWGVMQRRGLVRTDGGNAEN